MENRRVAMITYLMLLYCIIQGIIVKNAARFSLSLPRLFGIRRLDGSGCSGRWGPRRNLLPFAFLDGLAEEEFDLGVDGAEFVRGPGFQL